MNTSMILICIWLICRLGTALHTKCCGAVTISDDGSAKAPKWTTNIIHKAQQTLGDGSCYNHWFFQAFSPAVGTEPVALYKMVSQPLNHSLILKPGINDKGPQLQLLMLLQM